MLMRRELNLLLLPGMVSQSVWREVCWGIKWSIPRYLAHIDISEQNDPNRQETIYARDEEVINTVEWISLRSMNDDYYRHYECTIHSREASVVEDRGDGEDGYQTVQQYQLVYGRTRKVFLLEPPYQGKIDDTQSSWMRKVTRLKILWYRIEMF